jgi:hypothetical protein
VGTAPRAPQCCWPSEQSAAAALTAEDLCCGALFQRSKEHHTSLSISVWLYYMLFTTPQPYIYSSHSHVLLSVTPPKFPFCLLLTLPTFCACVYTTSHSTTAELQNEDAWIIERYCLKILLSDYCCFTPALSAVNQPKSPVTGKRYHCQHLC